MNPVNMPFNKKQTKGKKQSTRVGNRSNKNNENLNQVSQPCSSDANYTGTIASDTTQETINTEERVNALIEEVRQLGGIVMMLVDEKRNRVSVSPMTVARNNGDDSEVGGDEHPVAPQAATNPVSEDRDYKLNNVIKDVGEIKNSLDKLTVVITALQQSQTNANITTNNEDPNELNPNPGTRGQQGTAAAGMPVLSNSSAGAGGPQPNVAPPTAAAVASSSSSSWPRQQQQHGTQHMQNGVIHTAATRDPDSLNTSFLNRLRAERARFMIVFGLEEVEEDNTYSIGPMEQKVIDRYTLGEILKDMNQSQLIYRVAAIQRLGGKAVGKIRPLRVEFHSALDRETACRNAHHLKNSDRFRHTASISRDKIREDRELDRAKYQEEKRRKNESNASESQMVQPTTSNEQISAMLSGARAETNTTVGQDTAHPHEAEAETLP